MMARGAKASTPEADDASKTCEREGRAFCMCGGVSFLAHARQPERPDAPPRKWGRWRRQSRGPRGGGQLTGRMVSRSRVFPVSPEKQHALAARMRALGVREEELEEHFV